jgi:hypothetical protein
VCIADKPGNSWNRYKYKPAIFSIFQKKELTSTFYGRLFAEAKLNKLAVEQL